MSKRVHQIAFNDSGVPRLRGYSRDAVASVRQWLRGYEHHLWTVPEAREFLRAHFAADVLQAFDDLVPYAYKGDLFKYCLMKQLGGWVVDLGVTLLQKPTGHGRLDGPPDFVLFRATALWSPSWNCSIALLYARAGHPVFDSAIERVVQNCQQRYYGQTPLMPTMSPFGRAVALHELFDQVRVGEVVDVHGRPYARAFRLKPEGLVAARKPPAAGAGNVADIGFKGGNDYAALWRERRVYGEAPV